MVQPPRSSPGFLYLSDADLLQADHLGATARPTSQPHLQDFTFICERSRRRSCQGQEPPDQQDQRAIQAALR